MSGYAGPERRRNPPLPLWARGLNGWMWLRALVVALVGVSISLLLMYGP